MMTTALTRLVLAGVTGGVVTCAGAGAALAAPVGPSTLPAAERSAATSAAADSTGLTLARRAAAAGDGTSARSMQAQSASLVSGSTTEVYVLDRGFVTSGTGPVARLGYVSNTAKVGQELVSVWSVKAKDGSWRAINAATGDVEARYARSAQGGRLFREPQINAWYALKGDRVVPLNGEAKAAVGSGMSLTAYQQLVHGKYADKVPGSAYDKAGMAGGFGSPAQAAPAAAPAAAAAVAAPAAPAQASFPTTGTALAGVGGLGLLAAGATVARRRARR